MANANGRSSCRVFAAVETIMKKVLANLGFAAFYVYFVSFLLIAAPYFNWRYSRLHGFVNWLLLGEVVATSQAAAWPYYAIAHFWSHPSSRDSDSDVHYDNSKSACDEAIKVIIKFGGVTTLPPKDVGDVVQLFQASVTEAKLVQNSYLERVHPEFVRRYQEDYIGSMQTLAEAIHTNDRAKQISAIATFNSYSAWMKIHAKEFKFP